MYRVYIRARIMMRYVACFCEVDRIRMTRCTFDTGSAGVRNISPKELPIDHISQWDTL